MSRTVRARLSFVAISALTYIPLALVFTRLRPVAVVSALVLHAGIFVLLGLDYSAWAGTVVILFVDWSYSTTMARSGQLSAPMRA